MPLTDLSRGMKPNEPIHGTTGDMKKNIININELEGRVCYFSLSGDLALKAYEETALKHVRKDKSIKLRQAVIDRLYFAMLMFDKVVMHCSDPLRNKMIYEVLFEHKNWIAEGKIVFIFSKSITNIPDHYKKYIERKSRDYSDGYFCENEKKSLEQEYMTEDYYNKLIDLINLSPYLIRKQTDSKYSFNKLVQNDLSTNQEQIIIGSPPTERAKIEAMNLSLYQLLKMKYIDKEKTKSVFPDNIADEVRNTVEEYLESGIMIARSAIVEALKEKLKSLNRQQEAVLNAITLRMDVLYCKMNSGERLILEFHPSYEKQSIYQYKCFEAYLRKITGNTEKIGITFDLVNDILKSNTENQYELLCFRDLYLACIADTHERTKLNRGDESNTMEEIFKVVMDEFMVYTNADDQFNSIKMKLLEGNKK